MTTHTFTCPQCGAARTPKNAAIAARYMATVTCEVCTSEIGRNGYGKHLAKHRRLGEYSAGDFRGNQFVKDNQLPEKRTYNKRGEWTVSLVNGKKQIAATVSDPVAKRIIAMLVQ